MTDTKPDNPAKIPRGHWIRIMRDRIIRARKAIKNDKKDWLDRDWELRQMLLQTLREKGWDVRLREGDIGFYDDLTVDDVAETVGANQPAT